MQIRPGVYRLHETVEIYGSFAHSNGTAMDARNITITIRKPPPDNYILGPYFVPLVDGEAFFDYDPDIVGTYKVRLECSQPKSAVAESKFEVVPLKT